MEFQASPFSPPIPFLRGRGSNQTPAIQVGVPSPPPHASARKPPRRPLESPPGGDRIPHCGALLTQLVRAQVCEYINQFYVYNPPPPPAPRKEIHKRKETTTCVQASKIASVSLSALSAAQPHPIRVILATAWRTRTSCICIPATSSQGQCGQGCSCFMPCGRCLPACTKESSAWPLAPEHVAALLCGPATSSAKQELRSLHRRDRASQAIQCQDPPNCCVLPSKVSTPGLR